MVAVITTERLHLIPLGPTILQWIDAGDVGLVQRALGARVPAGWTETIPARVRLEQLATDASQQPWLVRAMALRQSRQVVGSVGFHAAPDEYGRVEIGYDVVPAHRRHGYAREAILALTRWAFRTERARICVASVAPDNTASIALVRSFGFHRTGERIDAVDGLEYVFERALPISDQR